MKTVCFIGSLLLAAAGYAAHVAENYETAKSLVGEDGYVIFAYAKDWDKRSRQVCERLLADEKVQRAAGQAVLMRQPVPDLYSEKRHEVEKERFGELVIPDAPSYPALILLSPTGRHYATLSGEMMSRADSDEISSAIRDILGKLHLQENLLRQAQKLQGLECARTLGQAASIPGIKPQADWKELIERIKQCDPKDETGYARALIPPFELSLQIGDLERNPDAGWKKALEKAQLMIDDPVYTIPQRQAIYAACIGILHRHAGVGGSQKLCDFAKKMQALDPDSYLGQTADSIVREWAVRFNLSEGWHPGIFSTDHDPLRVDPPIPITEAGTYKVTLTYTRGRHAAHILAVSLYDGVKLVAEDRHDGSTGEVHRDNVYTLTVKSPVRDPQLFIQFDQSHDSDPSGYSDSYGKITITH